MVNWPAFRNSYEMSLCINSTNFYPLLVITFPTIQEIHPIPMSAHASSKGMVPSSHLCNPGLSIYPLGCLGNFSAQPSDQNLQKAGSISWRLEILSTPFASMNVHFLDRDALTIWAPDVKSSVVVEKGGASKEWVRAAPLSNFLEIDSTTPLDYLKFQFTIAFKCTLHGH